MCDRAYERSPFGKPIAEQGVFQDWVAEARIRIEQVRLLVLKTAWLMDTVGNRGAAIEISAIKVAAPAMATWVIDRAIQAFGGAGVSQDRRWRSCTPRPGCCASPTARTRCTRCRSPAANWPASGRPRPDRRPAQAEAGAGHLRHPRVKRRACARNTTSVAGRALPGASTRCRRATSRMFDQQAQEEQTVLETVREQVLERGVGLAEEQALACLRLADDQLPELLQLAHEVRMRHCGPEVEVEGIVSLKTGGCPEDCHFCSQSGLFASPVRAAWLDIPSLVKAADETAATGATEFCIVAAVRGPDARLMAQVARGRRGHPRGGRHPGRLLARACSRRTRSTRSPRIGVHRYNHNLETARSHFPQVVTTHTWEERWETLPMVRDAGMEVCCGGILGMGETLEQRAEFAAQLAELEPGRGAAELPQPAPGHAVRRPAGDAGQRRAADGRGRSGWRCPARSCASPAAASSPSATSPPTACSAGSTPSSSATT